MYLYVNKRVELAGRGVGLQKMYALLFYYYQLQSPFRHLTLGDIQLFILLLALKKRKEDFMDSTAKTLGWCERKVHSMNAKHDTFGVAVLIKQNLTQYQNVSLCGLAVRS